jgi:large-conductance mechanosensitive channel
MLMFRILALLVFALSFSADQDTTQLKPAANKTVQKISIDTDKLQEFKQNEDYQYKPKDIKKNFLEKIADWLSAKWDELMEWIFGEKKGSHFLSFMIKYLPYLLLAIGVFIIIRLLYKYDVFKRRAAAQNQPDIQLADDEKIVKSSNISDLIKNAKVQKDHRMAVRYLYLNLLRQLDTREYIRFKKDKTNDDYIAELSDQSLISEFENLTYYYDFIWYGQYPVDEALFSQIEQKFDHFLAQINKKAA